MALSPDGRWLAAGSGHNFRLHDLTAGGTIAFNWDETDGVHALAFSPDGRRLATVGRFATIVWDTDPDAHMTDAERAPSSAATPSITTSASGDPIGRPTSRPDTGASSPDTSGRPCVASPPSARVWLSPPMAGGWP